MGIQVSKQIPHCSPGVVGLQLPLCPQKSSGVRSTGEGHLPVKERGGSQGCSLNPNHVPLTKTAFKIKQKITVPCLSSSLCHRELYTPPFSHTHTHTHTPLLSLSHTHPFSLSHTHTPLLSLTHTHPHTQGSSRQEA